MSWRILTGDCRELLAGMDEASVDSIVCDPPYELGFMGKRWDASGVAFDRETWRAALRVLKPGGHLVAFGGTRTYHRMACAIEDAGFEIRDCLMWLYGSGFPKSHDVSKAIDKMLGAERERYERPALGGSFSDDNGSTYGTAISDTPATATATAWRGWGTALKPAYEPIILARKPLVGTVAANVLEHGTGALNIDGCRIDTGGGMDGVSNRSRSGEASANRRYTERGSTSFSITPGPRGGSELGRWPANITLDEEAAALLDEQSGTLTSGKAPESGFIRNTDKQRNVFAAFPGNREEPTALYGDTGGASRFFYTAKASRSEREKGLDHFERRAHGMSGGAQKAIDEARDYDAAQSIGLNRVTRVGNHHPTVKPVELMRWLCRLVTPPRGLVLDPFCGSGTTGIAALAEGFSFIGCEMNPDYAEIAEARIIGDAPLLNSAIKGDAA